MRIRKRNQPLFGKKIFFISAILILNITGISYAYWNDLTEIPTYVSTGEIQLVFLDGYSIEPMKGVKNLSVEIQNNSLNINAEVVPRYEGVLNYTLKNTGSIPVKINNKIILPNDKQQFEIGINPEFSRKVLEYTQWNEK